ncbi:MAG TPA: universal stress protein [Longimicrobiales bacterium]|nr:universal stress protein [Longimicrobiales bacterium]
MIRSVLVPLDGSASSEWALPTAVAIARASGAKLELVSVHVPLELLGAAGEWGGYQGTLEATGTDHALAYLRGVADRVSAAAGVAATPIVRVGRAADALVRHAEQAGSDLVVLSTHGHGPIQRAWLGSVADAVARHSPVPVLLVRPEPDAVPDLTGGTLFRHILVPLDGSAFGEEVLGTAVALGALGAADYTLLEVVYPPFVIGPVDETLSLHVDEELLRQRKAAADAYLRGVAERLRADGLEVETVVVVEPSTVASILDYAAKGADLIALTTHGRGGLGRVVLGSVADKVVRGAASPVLLYRPRGR